MVVEMVAELERGAVRRCGDFGVFSDDGNRR